MPRLAEDEGDGERDGRRACLPIDANCSLGPLTVAANTIAAQSRTAKGVSVQKSTAKDPCVGISLVPGDLAGVVADE